MSTDLETVRAACERRLEGTIASESDMREVAAIARLALALINDYGNYSGVWYREQLARCAREIGGLKG